MPKRSENTKDTTQVTPDPSLEKRSRRDFTPEYKTRIVALADNCKRGELGELLRKERLYSGQIIQWRKELRDGDMEKLAKSAPGPKAKLSNEHKEICRLEKRIKRLERELEISNSCIELQKKAFRILDLQKSENDS
jgi:transposase-like protein